ncbi:hypothetical protein SRB5_61140 [Streptomyces sp. RB5]|uniref:PIN domain-containing protein n=1 Tax=Streptomyces smaragdinus TaxID=2585196 RepID=A0A7K0CSE3_9ACTN|nr:hypothetical protein [Streptomyces smaragdinus]MQY15922.1 hypothetical protein [Streptomyces smaragdinus]
MSVIVYDTGMLIALVNQDRRARARHAGFVAAGGHPAVVPGPALSQAWRTSPKTAYAWKRLLAETFVLPAGRACRPDEAQPGFLPCTAGLGVEDWKTVGDILGKATLPPKKRPDPVGALSVLIAAKHGGGTVMTSDADDIEAYAATVEGCEIVVTSV